MFRNTRLLIGIATVALVLAIALTVASRPAFGSGLDAGDNRAPEVSAWAPAQAQMGSYVALSSCVADPDGDAVAVAWTVRGPRSTVPVSLGRVTRWWPTGAGTFVFTAWAADEHGAKATATVTVDVNAPPCVSIRGARSVAPGTPVTLTAVVSDSDSDPVSIRWMQTGGTGPALDLAGIDALNMSFLPALAGTYTFLVVARDGQGGVSTATFTLTATSPPVAFAGSAQTAYSSRPVTLSGCGYDPEGASVSFSWSRDTANPGDGPGVILRDRCSAMASFTPPRPGRYGFRLTVTNAGGASATSTVVVTAIARPNQSPIAFAQPPACATVRAYALLRGGATDADGDCLSYRWTQVSGPSAYLYGACAASCSFYPYSAGVYVLRLTATDGMGGADSELVTVTVTAPPRAWATAPQMVAAGLPVQLSGGATGPAGVALQYRWTRLSGPACELEGYEGANASFVPRCAGTYRFALRVTAGCSESTASVSVIVNTPPTVRIEPVSPVFLYTPATARACGSDLDRDYLYYRWSYVSGPVKNVSFYGGSTNLLRFTPTVAGTYNFKVTVKDARGAEASATVGIVARSRNRARVHARLGDSSALPMVMTTWTLENTPAAASVLSTEPTPVASFRVTVTEGRTGSVMDVDSHLGFVNEGLTAVPVTVVTMTMRYRATDGRYVQTALVGAGDPAQLPAGTASGPLGGLTLLDDAGNVLGSVLPALAGDSSACFRLRARFTAADLDATAPVQLDVRVGLGEDSSRCDCQVREHKHCGRSAFFLQKTVQTSPARRVNDRVVLTDMFHSLPDATLAAVDRLQVSGVMADGTAVQGAISSTSSFQVTIAQSGNAGARSTFVVAGPVRFAAGRCGTTPAATIATLAGSGAAPSDVRTLFGSPSTASIDLIDQGCSNQGKDVQPGDFVTFTQGGWGSKPHGNNPGSLREEHFEQVFPAGLKLGEGIEVLLTDSEAVEEFLPQGGTAGALTTSAMDPESTEAGVLGGQAVALMLSVGFSAAGKLAQSDPMPLGQLVVASGPFAGLTVDGLLSVANKAIGGQASALPAGASYSDLNDALTSCNECFDNGLLSTGFLRKP